MEEEGNTAGLRRAGSVRFEKGTTRPRLQTVTSKEKIKIKCGSVAADTAAKLLRTQGAAGNTWEMTRRDNESDKAVRGGGNDVTWFEDGEDN